MVVEAFVMIKVGGYKVYPQNVYKEKIGKIPGVVETYILLGRYDLLAKIKVKDLDEAIRIIDGEIRNIPGVQSTETFIAY